MEHNLPNHNSPDRESQDLANQADFVHRDIPPSDIIAEKNIWQVLKASLALPKSVFNSTATASFFGSMLIYVFFTENSIEEIRIYTLDWAEKGFDFSTSILGFLVAGLAIFTAVNDVSFFTCMSRVRHKSGLSFLKYNFLSLMYVFVVYIGLIVSCFVIQIFSQDGNLISLLFLVIKNISPDFNVELFALLIFKAIFVFLSTLFFYCLMLLKTFVFDIYHLTMSNIRWNVEEENQWKDEN